MLDTPIVSIYDMMVERHLKMRRELKDAVKGAAKEKSAVAEVKKPIIKSKPLPMKFPHTPELKYWNQMLFVRLQTFHFNLSSISQNYSPIQITQM